MSNTDQPENQSPRIIKSAALGYGRAGLKIYPSPRKDGAAYVKWKEASTSEEATIRQWWTKWPDALICLDCGKSEIGVIDVDTLEGHNVDGEGSLLDLEMNNEFLPATRQAQSPSKGRHLFFRDPGALLKTTKGRLGVGLDTRGRGGMVVLTPSVVKGTGSYQWLNKEKMALIPQWVLDLTGKPNNYSPIPDAEFEPVYTPEEFKELLNLLKVDDFRDHDDKWLPLMLACTHSSTVLDGKEAFMDWTTGNGEGEYAGDWDIINDRWDINYTNSRNKGGNAARVGTFNKFLTDAGFGDRVQREPDLSAADDGLADDPIEPIEPQGIWNLKTGKLDPPDLDKIEREKREREDRARERREAADAGLAPASTAKRPVVVMLPSRSHETVDATQDILLRQANKVRNANGGSKIADQLFQRDGKLVRLSRNLHKKQKASGAVANAETKEVDGVVVDSSYQELNALSIVPVRPAWLTTRLTRAIEFQGPSAGKPGAKPKLVPKDVKPNIINQLIEAGEWKFPALFNTVEAPTLRPDGTILDEPGFDPTTGLFFDPGRVKFDKIRSDPTTAQGNEAMKYLDLELLSSFPFVDQSEDYKNVSRSAAMGFMLTAPNRRMFPTAPAFAADSNEPESGKSMLLKAAGALMTGREIAGRPFSQSEEERRKALGTAFVEARPFLFFDNVDCTIEGASLEMALTSAHFDDRKLGSHEGISAPTNSLMAFSANHLEIGGNGMTTRIHVSRLVPTQSLKQRLMAGAFRHPSLIPWIIQNRPKLISAVLTALRAFVLHGRAKADPTISRFPEWGALIGNALIWYGYPDPTRSGDEIRKIDPVHEAMRDVIRAWMQSFPADAMGVGPAVTAATLLGSPTVKEAISAATKVRQQDLNSMLVAGYVRRMVGVLRLELPYRVVDAGGDGHAKARMWRLEMTADERAALDEMMA